MPTTGVRRHRRRRRVLRHLRHGSAVTGVALGTDTGRTDTGGIDAGGIDAGGIDAVGTRAARRGAQWRTGSGRIGDIGGDGRGDGIVYGDWDGGQPGRARIHPLRTVQPLEPARPARRRPRRGTTRPLPRPAHRRAR